MAVSQQRMAEASEPEVSNCVTNLIRAFTDGLDIFKRLRERRRRRKSGKHGEHRESREKASGAELQLSNSLRRGPTEIKDTYEKNYGKAGEKFARGDPIAHASLAETLIKLNTGLVGIIAAFLNHDSKSNRLELDYKSLVSLSDASRVEAIDSLDRLCSRLSQSQLHVYRIGGCPSCGSQKHATCSGRNKTKQPIVPRSGAKSPQSLHKPTVARVGIKGTTQTQYAVVRPRPKNARKGSSSSASSTSGKSQSTALYTPLDSPNASPLGSPLPQYSPRDPFPPQPIPLPKDMEQTKAVPNIGRRRANSIDGPRPTTWPHVRPDNALPLPPTPKPTNIPRKSPDAKSPRSPPPKEKRSPPPSAAVPRRRMDKVTPSTYTFASDSTKLGEIPQKNWATPWNFEEAERLNAEAAIIGYPEPVAPGKAKKKGLFGFLRRGSATNA